LEKYTGASIITAAPFYLNGWRAFTQQPELAGNAEIEHMSCLVFLEIKVAQHIEAE